MVVAYKPVPTPQKINEIQEALKGYWERDEWNIRDPFFDELRPKKWLLSNKQINFSKFKHGLKEEIKIFFSSRLQEHTLKLNTLVAYSSSFKMFSSFLEQLYPDLKSFTALEYDKTLLKWRTFLVGQGVKVKVDGSISNRNYLHFFKQLFEFIYNYYDEREEYEKDVWDVRKIPGAKFTNNYAHYTLSFIDIQDKFRSLSKRYIKYRLSNVFLGQCSCDLRAMRLFFKFINIKYPQWKGLKLLSRKDMEEYFTWYPSQVTSKIAIDNYKINLRTFLEHIQLAEYPEAPEKPVANLIWKEDITDRARKSEKSIKFIPEEVLLQLEDKLKFLEPEFIPVVVLLRASGWRVSDILNLCYDSCYERTSQGWWLCGDIVKTKVLGHRVPITDEVAAIVLALVETVKEKSTAENNPNNLLFPTFTGRRKGLPLDAKRISKAINRLATKHNILDLHGEIFHFNNHAFRHTKGVELINNGMNLVHVQKWMAHASPEMTLRYAKILDTTMRKSWEETTKNGIFRIDSKGKAIKIDPSDIQNKDLIEWEWVRSNLDAVRVPLGYCFKSSKIDCKHQINPCLTCRNFCTTPSEIPEFEMEIRETKEQINRGNAQGRKMWVEKNQTYLDRLETILKVLKEGKIHHQAGKKGREYVGAEREHA